MASAGAAARHRRGLRRRGGATAAAIGATIGAAGEPRVLVLVLVSVYLCVCVGVGPHPAYVLSPLVHLV